jgi:uncharacterized RDD family membrane protein YckC
MSSAAQRDETPVSYPLTGTEGVALKQLAAERLAAHRNRRAVVEGLEAKARREQIAAQTAVRQQARLSAARDEVRPAASRVRDAVAARYQQSVSYREFLAAEAQRAMEQAQAEAEVAARNAKAVAAVQQQLLAEIEQWNQPVTPVRTAELFEEAPLLEVVETRAFERVEPAYSAPEPALERFERVPEWDGTRQVDLRVRLHEEIAMPSMPERLEASYAPRWASQVAPEELAELEDEIAFRMAPEFEDLVMETLPIQANIIEFPRQLVASRKARPRLAEGPLREDGTPQPQLRIFEVEPEQISVEPEAVAVEAAPEWQGLLLGATTTQQARAISPQLEAQLQLDHELHAPKVSRRVMAAAVDALCLGAGLAGFGAVVVKIAGESLHSAPIALLGAAAAGTLAAFTLMYYALFFTLNEATPGMKALRLAFCTFDEKNPSRKAIRRRLLAMTLSACPLGLGLWWMALDSDGLGWHDRMSRMYPRGY